MFTTIKSRKGKATSGRAAKAAPKVRPASKASGETAEKPPAKRRGRPRGTSEQGLATRERLYQTAIREFARRGYEETTLRHLSERADVSLGLVYRYFPSKRAIVLELYDRLSREFADRAQALPQGSWSARFLVALRASLGVLAPHRDILVALAPLLVGSSEDGVLATNTAFSRERVAAVFVAAVTGATDAPDSPTAESLGRLLYVTQLAVILFFLFDRSVSTRATDRLLAWLESSLPLVSLAIGLDAGSEAIRALDALVREGLIGPFEASRPPDR